MQNTKCARKMRRCWSGLCKRARSSGYRGCRSRGAIAQGMSYWTYTDLFEEPGPPTAPFQGGFGLLNPEGIRKPAFFAYKYLNALGGKNVSANDAQAML